MIMAFEHFLKQFKDTNKEHTSRFGIRIIPQRHMLESVLELFKLTKDYWVKKTVGKQS